MPATEGPLDNAGSTFMADALIDGAKGLLLRTICMRLASKMRIHGRHKSTPLAYATFRSKRAFATQLKEG
jgi:hypothetical protein